LVSVGQVPGSDAEEGQIPAAARTEKPQVGLGQKATRLLAQPTPTEPSIELKIGNRDKAIHGSEVIIHVNSENSFCNVSKTRTIESASINQVISKPV
jgi:hypothetical protein